MDRNAPYRGGAQLSETFTLPLNLDFTASIWTNHDRGATFYSSPVFAVVNGEAMAFIGSVDGKVSAFDRAGNLVWAYQTGNSVYAAPAVGTLPGGGEVAVFGSSDGKIYEADGATGALTWAVPTGAPLMASPLIADGAVVEVDNSGSIWKLDLSTGSVLWKTQTGRSYGWAGLASDGVSVFLCSTNGTVSAYSLGNGAFAWERTFMAESFRFSPALAGSRLYVPGQTGLLYCLDAGSGASLWGSPVAQGSGGLASPAVDARFGAPEIYLASADGTVAKYQDNGVSATQVWSADAAGAIYGSPSLSGNLCFVATRNAIGTDSHLLALDLTDGQVQQNIPLPGQAGSSGNIAVAAGRLFMAGDKGYLLSYICSTVTVTPTESPTATATPSSTETATQTASPTASPSPTSTPNGLPCLPNGVVANALSVVVGSQALVDSYDSSLGPYGPGNTGADAGVQAAGAITIASGGQVHGTLHPNAPPGLTPVPPPYGAVQLGNMDVTGPYMFEAGDYVADNLSINGAVPVSVNGRVRIWFNNLNMAGTVGAGSAVPAQLSFFSLPTAGQVNINGGPTAFSGLIFAPNVPINVNGTGDIYGGIVGSNVVLNSVIGMHVDAALSVGCGTIETPVSTWTVSPSLTWTETVEPTVATTATPTATPGGAASGTATPTAGAGTCAIVYGNDAAYVNAGYSNDYTSGAMSLGQSGQGSILLVVVGAENATGTLTVAYAGMGMAKLAGPVVYGNSSTSQFSVYYLANPASGGTLHVAGTGLSPFSYMWFTYGGVDATTPIGAAVVANSTVISSCAGSLQSNAFSFTPTNPDSTIVEYMAFADGSGNAGTGYAVANGTVRRTSIGANNNHMTGGAFGDYAPGSTAPFSLGQSINPNWSCFGGMLWGIELLPDCSQGQGGGFSASSLKGGGGTGGRGAGSGTDMVVAPNPIQGKAVVHFTTQTGGVGMLFVKDITGASVGKWALGEYGVGAHAAEMDLSQVSSGIYLVLRLENRGEGYVLAETAKVAVLH